MNKILIIQLLIATEEMFKEHTVNAALSEVLSRALCPLVCASGCDGRLNRTGVLTVSLLFVHCLPCLHLDLEPGFYKSGRTIAKSGAATYKMVRHLMSYHLFDVIPLVVVLDTAPLL